MNEKLDFVKSVPECFGVVVTDEQLEQFVLFNSIISEFNKHTNLMSPNDISIIFEKHFTDSLSFCKYIPSDTTSNIIDIGSGGGFPVIPMAIILKNAKIISVDSTGKKVDFLNMAANKIGLKNFLSINDRAETLAFKKTYREKFDFVTARAVGSLVQISELCLPYLKIGGKFLAYKSIKVAEEIEQAKNGIKILGGKILDIFEYNLNLPENFTRNLVVTEKIIPTPREYPRSFSVIKNKPL